MKKILYVFSVIILFSSCNSNINFKNEIDSYGWRSSIANEYNFLYSFNQPIKKVTLRIFEAEDKFGDLIQTNLKTTISVEFNEQGIVIFSEGMYYKGAFKNIITENRLTSRTFTERNRVIEYRYNENNLRKYQSDFKNNELSQKILYKYNENKNIIELNSYTSDGNLKYKALFLYDENQNRKTMTAYKSSGELEGRISYKYDENQIQVERLLYDENEILINRVSSEYQETDNKENWIKCIVVREVRKKTDNNEFRVDGKVIIEREIIYFDN